MNSLTEKEKLAVEEFIIGLKKLIDAERARKESDYLVSCEKVLF